MNDAERTARWGGVARQAALREAAALANAVGARHAPMSTHGYDRDWVAAAWTVRDAILALSRREDPVPIVEGSGSLKAARDRGRP